MRDRRRAWFFGWVVTRKGSKTSGNWNHRGTPGRGGSAPGGGHIAIGISLDAPKEDTQDQIDAYREVRDAELKASVAPAYDDQSEAIDQDAYDLLGRDMGFPDNDWYMTGYSDDYIDRVEAIGRGIGEKAGLDPEDTLVTVSAWRSTSNDTSMRALSMQDAAGEEFGIELSEWQKGKLQEARETEPLLPSYQRMNQARLFTRPQEKKLARTMYDLTQKDLKAAGYKPGDTVRLYRGVSTSQPGNPGDVVNLRQNVLSSWSVSPTISRSFAKRGRRKTGKPGQVLAMDVPIENIFSTGRTGFGAFAEGEFVVLGVPGSQALITHVETGPTYG